MEAVSSAKEAGLASIGKICHCFHQQRDAFYKFKKRYTQRKAEEMQIIKLVEEQRKEQPRVGTRKLQELISPALEQAEIKLGRDGLFRILREHHMLVGRKRTTFKTTNSYHHFHKYSNLIKNMEVTAPNQVWVSDITYIRTVKGFCYLALITDMYSRKIVGYDISDTLELSGCLKALQKALRQSPISGRVSTSLRSGYSVLQPSICKRAYKKEDQNKYDRGKPLLRKCHC